MIDQLEFENLIEKVKRRKEEGDLRKAVKVADKIPWYDITDINILIFAASVYEEAEQYRDAKAILEYAYDIAPVKTRLYFSLSLINAKCKDLKEAISYYIDFCEAFPEDNRSLLLKYYILRAKGASYNQQMRVLSEYVAEDKDEKMTFELALLYDKLEQREEVLECCNFIINFYGVKKTGYGKNALLLKKKYMTLTEQEEKMLELADIGYVKDEDRDLEFTEPPNLYNSTRMDEEKVNIPVEKLERVDNKETIKEETENKEDELNENNVADKISISYTPDDESYAEKEKNKMAFLKDENDDKAKLRKLINELKEEEIREKSEFNKFRQKSFEIRRRFRTMKLSETKLNMVIEAHSKDEGVDIAQKELNYIHDVLGEKVSIAKASAYNMNEKGFAFYASKIKEKDLIIENAGQLKNEIIDDIEEYIINKEGKTIFALVDVINNFDKLATERPSFIGRFDVYSVLSGRPQESLDATKDEIEEFKEKRDEKKNKLGERGSVEKIGKPISSPVVTERQVESPVRETGAPRAESRKASAKPEYTVDEFVEHCREYAKSIDCALPAETIPVIYEKAEEMKDNNIPLNEENVVALIEEAADRAEKPKLFSKPKYDKEGCLILLGDHFEF